MVEIKTEKYKEEARRALKDQVLQYALADFQERLSTATDIAYRNLPEGPDLRFKAHDLRMQAIKNLDILLEIFAEKVRQNGGHIFFAEDGQAAINYCLKVARKHNVKQVVKGKSMVTEEIGLNTSLMAAGIEVTETDLGEYIVQLAGEHPSHIIAPAIHKTRKEIGQLFSEKLGIPYTNDPPSLTRVARKALREKFLTADMGISGCNLACAETGHITTVSNEGNIRMATTLSKVHVVFMGMERIVAGLEDYDVLFRLLSRAAAGQNMATYVSYIGGPRSDDQVDGPEEIHNFARGIPNAYQKLKTGVQSIRKITPSFDIGGRCAVHRFNYLHLRATVDAAHALDLNSISFSGTDIYNEEAFKRYGKIDSVYSNEFAITQHDFPKLEQELTALKSEYAHDFETGFISDRPEELDRVLIAYYRAVAGLADYPAAQCNAPWHSAVIEYNGVVRPCFPLTAYGTLAGAAQATETQNTGRTLEDVLNSPSAIMFRDNLNVERDETCRRCVCQTSVQH